MNGAWCVLRNYVAHAEEIGGEVPENPCFFLKPPSAIVEADEQGNAPLALGAPEEQIDHEVELVVRLGEDLRPEAVCVGCDTTNRTRQVLAKKMGRPWLEGKGFRGSGVCGTWAPYSESNFEIGLSVNGEVKQKSTTALMVHSIESLLKNLQEWYGLSPGDLIFTGTPEGVSPLKPGDRVDAWLKNSDGKIVSELHSTCN
jgi:fumarylpyruvate hydrolase